MSRALLILDTEATRQQAVEWCQKLKPGTRVEFKAPKRSDDQNAKMWAMLTEVSMQVRHHELRLSSEDWKLIFLDALKRENRLVPNLDGNGMVSLGRSSSDLSKAEMSDLIELIYEYGARNGVVFKEPASSQSPGDDAAGAGEVPPEPGADQSPDEASGGTGDGAVEVAEEPSAASSPAAGLSDEDRAWLKLIAKMLWAATAVNEQELLAGTLKGIRENHTPATISQAAKDKGMSIYKKCKLVCFGEASAADTLAEVAMVAGCEAKEIVA